MKYRITRAMLEGPTTPEKKAPLPHPLDEEVIIICGPPIILPPKKRVRSKPANLKLIKTYKKQVPIRVVGEGSWKKLIF